MSGPSIWKSKTLRRWTGLGILGLVWLGVMFGAAVPAWRRAQAKNLEIGALEDRLAEMDRWIVAGMWLERSVTINAPQIETAWNNLFPEERNREDLFLELAAVADKSRVTGFRLQEVKDTRMQEDHLWLDRPDGDIAEWMSGPIIGVDLGFYRIKANFRGDYRRVAEFLGGIKKIDRAMSIHSLDVQPDEEGVKVELKLDVYVRETSQS